MRVGRILHNNAGETIVEIMIVLAVLGSALGIAYATANKSLKGARQSQEHAEALQIAKGQLESLKYYLTNSPDVAPPTNVGFCVSTSGSLTTLQSNYRPINDSSDQDTLQNYGSCVDGLYHYGISYVPPANASRPLEDKYVATVRWISISSSNNDEVRLEYRIH